MNPLNMSSKFIPIQVSSSWTVIILVTFAIKHFRIFSVSTSCLSDNTTYLLKHTVKGEVYSFCLTGLEG